MPKYFEIRGQVGAGYKTTWIFSWRLMRWVDPITQDGTGTNFETLEDAVNYLFEAQKDKEVTDIAIVQYQNQTELE